MPLSAIIFLMEELNHAFASYALPFQTPLFQTAPLLSSVTRQQNLMEFGGKFNIYCHITNIRLSSRGPIS
jgi:hypothetical protein